MWRGPGGSRVQIGALCDPVLWMGPTGGEGVGDDTIHMVTLGVHECQQGAQPC